MNEDIVKAITRLETEMQHIKQMVAELKSELKQPKSPLLQVSGGVAGILAAAYVTYLQATGQA